MIPNSDSKQPVRFGLRTTGLLRLRLGCCGMGAGGRWSLTLLSPRRLERSSIAAFSSWEMAAHRIVAPTASTRAAAARLSGSAGATQSNPQNSLVPTQASYIVRFLFSRCGKRVTSGARVISNCSKSAFILSVSQIAAIRVFEMFFRQPAIGRHLLRSECHQRIDVRRVPRGPVRGHTCGDDDYAYCK